MTAVAAPTPGRNCDLCPRLADFRMANRAAYPDFFNAPVPSWGDENPALLVVGLAPGLKGANRTGRPFTGDYAGDLLYSTLIRYGFARGVFRADPNDGLELVRCRITNAVKCVPPENKPTPAETKICLKHFLSLELAAMPKLEVILALGQIAHIAVLDAMKVKRSSAPFGHGTEYDLPGGTKLVSSYHCSRYNTNTGRLTETMFHQVFDRIADITG